MTFIHHIKQEVFRGETEKKRVTRRTDTLHGEEISNKTVGDNGLVYVKKCKFIYIP